jgi:hypothetical protein
MGFQIVSRDDNLLLPEKSRSTQHRWNSTSFQLAQGTEKSKNMSVFIGRLMNGPESIYNYFNSFRFSRLNEPLFLSFV